MDVTWLFLLWWLSAAGVLLPQSPSTPAPSIAITIDDLPWVGPTRRGESQAEATARLLAAMKRRGVPATGFVVCGRARESNLTAQWLREGFELGNHSERHVALDNTSPSEYLSAVRSCSEYLQTLTGQSPRWYRFPQLRQGRDREARDEVARGLRDIGMATAHVSVDTADYLLAEAYGRALQAGDAALAERVRRDYFTHIVNAVVHYQETARRKIGRDVPHVLLLHANAMTSDLLGELLDRLKARGFRFVSLADALGDEVYARPDQYVGVWGVSWLYRVAPIEPDAVAWDRAEAERIEREFSVGARRPRSPEQRQ